MIFFILGFSWILSVSGAWSGKSLISVDPSGLAVGDTLSTPGDTVSTPYADTTAVDTVKKKTAGVDTSIFYGAERIDFFVPERVTVLMGEAVVKYQDMTLKAGRIEVLWREDLLYAEGVPDTVFTDSTQTEVDTILTIGQPEFGERGDVMTGERMVYNLKTKKGRVIKGQTQYQDGYYYGESIKKVGDKVMNVGQGYYTTCDLNPEPHYCFRSKKMKLIVQDKVIAKPIILYFGQVPVMAMPYGIFPHKSGRQSGIVPPTYGESARQGRYIEGLGYYWAPSDYWDTKATLDFYDRLDFHFHGYLRYNLRYRLRGNLSTAASWLTSGLQNRRRWEIRFTHSQQVSPSSRLSMNGTFVSDKSYYDDYSHNALRRMDRNLRSNATLTKSWPGTKNSMTLNLSHVKNLETGQVTQTLPQLSFRRSQDRFFEPEEEQSPRWYHSIYYSYNGGLKNWEKRNDQREDKFGLRHSLAFQSPQKLFKWLNVRPNLSYREEWFNEYKHYSWDEEDSVWVADKRRGFIARRTYSGSISANTKIYGMFTPKIGALRAIRHTVSPSVSFNYQPKIQKDPFFGYQYFEHGEDIFKGSIYGGTSRGKRQTMGISVGNLFQVKTMRGEEEKKFDLFTLNFYSNYNFLADSLKWGDLSTSFRANPVRGGKGILKSLSVDLSARHSPYLRRGEQKVDRFFFSEDRWERGKFMRLLRFSANTTLRLKGEAGMKGEEEAPLDTLGLGIEPGVGEGVGLAPSMGFTNMDIPWNMGLTLRYNYNPETEAKSWWLNTNVEMRVTKNWKVNYSARFDMVEKDIVYHNFVIYRDMHCWEGRFTWTPGGVGQGYYLKINVKSPQLKDLKVEKRKGRGSLFGF
ncbi:LPS-assembly protein LptD [candidate division KSB1 bacterium]|nr:LPS-assembly protein LptD [candidate division KSB1 bacterium]